MPRDRAVCRTTGPVADDERRPGQPSPSLLRRVLATAGAVGLLAGFGWLWWRGVPALYPTGGAGSDGDNARLNARRPTRAALLTGLVGLGALGTFWLSSRVYRITAHLRADRTGSS